MRLEFPKPKPYGRWREGVAFSEREVDAWIVSGGLLWEPPVVGKTTATMRHEGDFAMSDVEAAYKEAVEKVGSAQEAYLRLAKTFKGEIKNDITSISASADRVLRENEKMRAAYEAAAKTLTSPEMVQAIANAERLAKALESISALQSHSITFAVLDKKTAP